MALDWLWTRAGDSGHDELGFFIRVDRDGVSFDFIGRGRTGVDGCLCSELVEYRERRRRQGRTLYFCLVLFLVGGEESIVWLGTAEDATLGAHGVGFTS